jgi:hypothetical protein
MTAPAFLPTLAEVEDMISRIRLQLQYLSEIRNEVIARYIEYGWQTSQGDRLEISETIKPPIQVLLHASRGGTTFTAPPKQKLLASTPAWPSTSGHRSLVVGRRS